MKENSIKNERSSIEEDIEYIQNFLEYSQDMINDMDYERTVNVTIQQNEINALEHILSDYKRVLKENKELQEDRNKFKKALGKRITYCNELEKDLFENGSNYVIPKQKVKDKIEELKQERDETYTKFLGGNRTDENLSTRGKMIEGGIKVLQELLEESEE